MAVLLDNDDSSSVESAGGAVRARSEAQSVQTVRVKEVKGGALLQHHVVRMLHVPHHNHGVIRGTARQADLTPNLTKAFRLQKNGINTWALSR